MTEYVETRSLGQCSSQFITLNEALEMYINKPLWVHSAQNTSVEGISTFDIQEFVSFHISKV